jgi:hypothetical protein
MGDISLYATNVCLQLVNNMYANVVLVTLVSWHAIIGLSVAAHSNDQSLILVKKHN